jgi:hypothetical protein
MTKPKMTESQQGIKMTEFLQMENEIMPAFWGISH